MISLPRIYIGYIRRRPMIFWAFVAIPMLIGLATHYLIGGRMSDKGGEIQAVGLILVLHYAFTLLLFKDFSSSTVRKVLDSLPAKVILEFLFYAISAAAAILIYFILSDGS